MYTALDNAYSRAELRRTVDPRAEAVFVTAAVLGMFVVLRAKAPAPAIEGAVRVAIEHLDGLCTEAAT